MEERDLWSINVRLRTIGCKLATNKCSLADWQSSLLIETEWEESYLKL